VLSLVDQETRLTNAVHDDGLIEEIAVWLRALGLELAGGVALPVRRISRPYGRAGNPPAGRVGGGQRKRAALSRPTSDSV
jgi:hypothetical protein